MSGFGGGVASLSMAGGSSYVHPYDDMSNFSGATRVGSTDVIYYSSSGTYTFTDPNAGASKFRFTVVGGGGASEGDNNGWFSNTGAGGGGAARGEIQTASTLDIGVAQGGGSPVVTYPTVDTCGDLDTSKTNANAWIQNSVYGSDNGINRVYGRGGTSYVKEQSASVNSGNELLRGRGGLVGLAFYHNYGSPYQNTHAYYNLTSVTGNNGFGARYGNGIWHNGGDAYVNASGLNGTVTVSNGSVETGGIGGSAYHQSNITGSARHPSDPNTGSITQATNGENRTYAGGGGGGGASSGNGNTQGMGGTSSGSAYLLSGSGINPRGGNGAYSSTGADSGAAGGGRGGTSHYDGGPNPMFNDLHYAADGIVIVEFLNASELGV